MGIKTRLLVSLCLGLAMAAPARDLEEFLRDNGFANLTTKFAQQKVTMEVLPDLTDADLRELGLGLIGTRRLFARKVRTLALPPVEEGGVVEEGGREEEREGERVVVGGGMEEERVVVGGGMEEERV